MGWSLANCIRVFFVFAIIKADFVVLTSNNGHNERNSSSSSTRSSSSEEKEMEMEMGMGMEYAVWFLHFHCITNATHLHFVAFAFASSHGSVAISWGRWNHR